jgi:dTDP-4-amino-4,6-dideoxygalactose transaminase
VTIPVTKSNLPSFERYVEHLKKIWSTRWLTNDGEFVQLLTKNLENYLKVKNLVLMSNGTLTLHTALKAFQLKGQVITTPFTFAATTNVLMWEGLTPIFADIDPQTYNLDPVEIEKKITPKTTAILPVHVYGNPCNVKQIQEIADKYNLKIIYDAAHAFGVEYENLPITDFGDLSTLSFHATKVFNTIEGGAVITQDEKIVEKLKLMRNHGIASEEEVVLPGTNAKMNEFQAAMGLCNLENIDKAIKLRKTLFDRYMEILSCVEGIRFQKLLMSKHNYGYMPILLASQKDRDNTYELLLKHGIKSRKYFFPLTSNFNYFVSERANSVNNFQLRNADFVANRILCLPLYHDLEPSTVDEITTLVKKAVKNR